MFGANLARVGFTAVLVAVVLGLVVATACGGEPAPTDVDRSGSAGTDETGPESPPDAFGYGDASGGATDDSGAGGPSTGGGGGSLGSQLDRKIVRTATLELEVEDVSAAVRKVESVALAAGGFVSESNVFIDASGPEGDESVAEPKRTQSATVSIRVPAGDYPDVMEQLRGVAKEVRSERSEASEVTEEYTDLQARLRNLEATEASYLELLAKAGMIEDILSVQDRLNGVRQEIEQVQGRINLLDNLTDLATITVQLSLPAVSPADEGGKGWAQEAWDVAWESSRDVGVALGSVAIVGGVVMLWLAVPALLGFAAWRRFGWRLPRPPQSGPAGGTGTPA